MGTPLRCLKNTTALAAATMLLGTAAHSANSQDTAGTAMMLEEVIVTATKRKVDIRDIAGSVSAMTERDLRNLGAQSLADYITRVPGVVFNDYQPGVSEVVIRGIASTTYHEANQTTVGYYLNEIPLTEFSFPVIIPDIDTFDLQRVEVLRGPQGTLFGSSSLGGLVNYVVNEANAAAFDAGFDALLGSTRNAGEESYAAKGMVNIPLIADQLALRVVAFERFDAGYLDAPRRNAEGTNDLTARGARASLVWTPTDTARISYLGMYQEYDLEDQTYTTTPTLDRPTFVAEPSQTNVLIHSARLDQQLGTTTLSVIGSYTQKDGEPKFDYSVFYPPGFWTGAPVQAFGKGESDLTTVEVRLASDDTARFKWLIGANYADNDRTGLDRQYQQGLAAYIDANPAMFGGRPGSVLAPGDFFERVLYSGSTREEAVFGELAYDIVDRLTLTLGGRYFDVATSDVRLQLLENANLIPPYLYAPADVSESGFTPKVSLQYKVSDDFMVYALYSEGFRVGGVNTSAAATPSAPLAFDSDTTGNFEVGLRSTLLGGTATVDLSVFRIDWDDIQVRLFTPEFLAYTTNGGGAQVDGVELSTVLNLGRYVNFSTAISWIDAELTELLPDSFAPGGGYAEGTTLPGASEWTFASTLTIDLGELPFNPVLSLNHRYLSKAPVGFGTIIEKGDYHLVDLRLAFDVSGQVQVALFGKNLLDEYGILNAPFGDIAGAGSVTRPRTVGLSFNWSLR